MNKEKNLIISIILLALFIFITIMVALNPGGVLGEDRIFVLLGNRERNEVLLTIAKILAFFGSPKFLIPAITVTIVIGFIKNKRDFTVGLLMASLGTYIVNAIIKNIIRRPRPTIYMLAVEKSFSFPSGHAMVNTAIYLFIAYYISNYVDRKNERTYYFFAIVASVLMSLSRVYLGVHYLTDVLAGMIGGYLFFTIVTKSIILLQKKTQKIN